MKISDNILVGLSMPIYCEFYGSIIHYVSYINIQFDNIFTDAYTLVGLVINEDDENVYENYYIEYKGEIYLYSSTANIATKKLVWNKTVIVNYDKVKDHTTGQNHTFDLEYYLKAN